MERRDAADFGWLLKRRRRAAGLTQEGLAEQAGFSPHYISMLERGVRLPPPVTVDLLADALALTPDERRAWQDAVPLPPTSAASPRTLRAPVPPLLGRERELARIAALLRPESVRLLTLTGPGGVGKTRLAESVVTEIADAFPGGCVVVDLSPITDAAAVLPSIARALGIRDVGRGARRDRIIRVLGGPPRLLLLDSVERVLAAAPVIAQLLDACPDLTVLATSRAPLRLRTEQEFPLEPLALPALARDRPSADLAAVPAVALFRQRAQLVAPELAIAEDDLALVAAICRRLDGLPLAIELAAARLTHLSLPALHDRLANRLQLLTGGPRDLPLRQQRMRDTIAWSVDLLAPHEQRLFAALSVFVGSWSLGAAAAVDADEHESSDVVDDLRALVEQSLVVALGGGADPRYRMLDTIRDDAAERLATTGQSAPTQRRHADYFLQLAEEAEPALQGAGQDVWLRRLADEHDNLGAALAWLLVHGEATRALRLAGALWRYWQQQGEVRVGRRWLDDALAAAPAAPLAVRSKALWGASWLALQQGDYARARVLSQELLALAGAQDDPQGRRDALTGLGMAALEEGKTGEALPPLCEALALARGLGPNWRLAASLLNLGLATMHAGDLAGAELLLQEALAAFAALGDAAFAARTRHYLGYAALLAGDPAAASDQFRQSLEAAWAQQEPTGTVEGLEAVAAACAATGRDELGAQLAAVAAAWRDETGVEAHAFDHAVAQRYLNASRIKLGDAAWDAVWGEGHIMPLATAVEQALQRDD